MLSKRRFFWCMSGILPTLRVVLAVLGLTDARGLHPFYPGDLSNALFRASSAFSYALLSALLCWSLFIWIAILTWSISVLSFHACWSRRFFSFIFWFLYCSSLSRWVISMLGCALFRPREYCFGLGSSPLKLMTPLFCWGKMGFTLVGKCKGFSLLVISLLVLDAYFGFACLFDSRLLFCFVHVEFLVVSFDRKVYWTLGDMPLLFWYCVIFEESLTDLAVISGSMVNGELSTKWEWLCLLLTLMSAFWVFISNTFLNRRRLLLVCFFIRICSYPFEFLLIKYGVAVMLVPATSMNDFFLISYLNGIRFSGEC